MHKHIKGKNLIHVYADTLLKPLLIKLPGGRIRSFSARFNAAALSLIEAMFPNCLGNTDVVHSRWVQKLGESNQPRTPRSAYDRFLIANCNH